MPLGYIYIVLPLSGLLIAFYTALAWGNTWRALAGRPPLWCDAPGEGTLLDVD